MYLVHHIAIQSVDAVNIPLAQSPPTVFFFFFYILEIDLRYNRFRLQLMRVRLKMSSSYSPR